MSWLIALGIVIVGLALAFWYAREGVPRPIGGIEVAIIQLLRDGGLMTLTVPEFRDRIVFRKYIRNPDDCGLKVVVSEQDMPQERFAAATNFLTSRTHEWEETQVEDEAGHSHPALIIDLGTDSAEAARVLFDFFGKLYGLSRNDSIIVKLDDEA